MGHRGQAARRHPLTTIVANKDSIHVRFPLSPPGFADRWLDLPPLSREFNLEFRLVRVAQHGDGGEL